MCDAPVIKPTRDDFVDSCEIRAHFCEALSAMYRAEVPAYADLLAIVDEVNARVDDGSVPPRVEIERHGAIRVGTADELAMIARAFAVMGMEPVGYYDLAPAGVPVHSTAFRPVGEAELARNPFRVFCSLLRMELIGDPALRALATVRRQNIRHRSRRKLAEGGPRLGLGFRRRAYGVASADVRWSVA